MGVVAPEEDAVLRGRKDRVGISGLCWKNPVLSGTFPDLKSWSIPLAFLVIVWDEGRPECLGRHCPRTDVFETRSSVLEYPACQLAAQLSDDYLVYNTPPGQACWVVRRG